MKVVREVAEAKIVVIVVGLGTYNDPQLGSLLRNGRR